jgi:hypothetical protein
VRGLRLSCLVESRMTGSWWRVPGGRGGWRPAPPPLGLGTDEDTVVERGFQA